MDLRPETHGGHVQEMYQGHVYQTRDERHVEYEQEMYRGVYQGHSIENYRGNCMQNYDMYR